VHILTKIFVVLVSLLAIFMVPLVVVSTLNQEHWRGEALDQKTQLRTARNDLSQHRQQAQGQVAMLNEELAIYSQREQSQIQQIESLAMSMTQTEAQLLETRSQLASREAMQLALAQSLSTSNGLSKMLIGDLDNLRTRTVTAESQRVKMDERLAQAEVQLQSAADVSKVLREENASLKQEQQRATEALDKFAARFGSLDGSNETQDEGIAPDRNLTSTVLNVLRGDSTLIEIDAGSRDGVQEGWILTIGDGGTFIGRLRIISVDLNRSTGLLELEDPARGLAEAGHHAYALEGEG
jgi:hypothetical protein